MTLEQVRGTIEAVERTERRRLQQALMVARGAQADMADYKKLYQSLEG